MSESFKSNNIYINPEQNLTHKLKKIVQNYINISCSLVQERMHFGIEII